MIKINKSSVIPDILLTKGTEELANFCKTYDSEPENYRQESGTKNLNLKKFEANAQIYGHKTVKKQLIEDQFKKCCFCESKIISISHGDIEHFRPTTAYNKKNETSLSYPGYYWLAYDWQNLFFSCQICNQKYKKNNFPLLDEKSRMKCHYDAKKINNEQNLLIHPSSEDPENYIYFIEEFPKARNERGQMNITTFGIDRKELDEDRRNYLNSIKIAMSFALIDINDPQQIELAFKAFKLPKDELLERIKISQNLIGNAAKKQSVFASMVRSNFPELPRN